MNQLETAELWLDRGIPVIPLAYRTKIPAADALRLTGDFDEDGRTTWGPYQKALPARSALRRWFGGPRRNLGLVCGWQGLVVVDFDSIPAYLMWVDWAERAAPAMLSTYQVLTSRGVHLYVLVDEPAESAKVGEIDIKAAGGFVLASPSVHPSGRLYQAVDPTAPIIRVPRLADVLPFVIHPARHERPVIAMPEPAEHSDDPWKMADNPPGFTDGGGPVAAIRRQVRIEDLLPEAAQGHGRWVRVRCPFHHDANPSFWVDREGQICGCFAGCTEKPLDVIGLYARLNDIDNREAIRRLAACL